ncbi:thioredoxin family protein [Clostridium massiliodielmoense]|uniref:thioredoxin family protein n=1 Tax=Clostridium massiliodielmoense TaxID=1776385 RepID=UPI0001668EAE|nr:thioredoxin family protein [Clostridium massiliodielmoense]EDS77356.1 thioredoxin [Clostridium botulinum C str. Eklund]KEH95067.1 thioredoxin [Clostridium botulinum C/D str. BKT12695]NEZ50306.1 thioredoxin family protein [Clostridium botulinum]
MKRLTSIEDIKNFISTNKLALIYVTSKMETCSVCHMLLPKIQEQLKKYSKLEIGTVDSSEVLEVAGEFSIFSLPLIMFYAEGKEVLREGRFITMDDLKSTVDRYYNFIYK